MASEFELIERHLAHLTPLGEHVRRGIGDDCAVVTVPAGHELAVSIDTLNAGVHFPADTAPEDVGWKALACGLSDLAAAGAAPAWCTLALTLTAAEEDWLAAFAAGFGALAARHGVTLAGGDTTRGPGLAATVQVAGLVPEGAALTRAGACVGDVVCVSGTPGEAAAGLAQALAGTPGADPALRARLDRPLPRVALGQALRGRASACIDVSDGLAADAAHIAAASGVGIVLDAGALPVSPALAAAGSAAEAREWLLHGGDDYELCFTLPPAIAADAAWQRALDVAVTPIGRVDTGPGVRLRTDDGDERALEVRGYRHFDGS